MFQRVEGILYRYYRKKQQIQRLKKSLNTIEEQIKDIRRILSDKEALRPSLGIVGKYMIVVGGEGGGFHSDPVDRTYQMHIKTIEQLQNKLSELMQRKIKLKMRIFKLEQEIDGIEFAIGELSEIEKKIVEQKYFYKRSNVQIGIAINCDEATVRRKRKEIVEKIANMLQVV